MTTRQEETDVIITQQVITAIEEGTTCLKIISGDTEVFALLLRFYIEQSLSTTIFLEAKGSNGNIFDIGKITKKYKDAVTSLLAAYTLRRCDSVCKLYGLGKISVFFLLQTYPLQYLGETSVNISDNFQEGKTFVAVCYGITSTTYMLEITCVF